MTIPGGDAGSRGIDALSSRDRGAGWWLALAALAALALALRLPGIRFDLPYTYPPDEASRVVEAFWMLSEGTLHPRWFGHPATPMLYLLMGTYGAIYLVLAALGRVGSFPDLEALFYRDPTIFYLSARLWSALFGVACVVTLAELGRRWFGRAVGFVAAVALAIQPLTVAYSKLARIDTLLPFLALLGVGFALRATEEGRPRQFALVGAIAGVATMTKYPGALVVLLVPVGLLLRGELATRRGARILAGSLVALVGFAFVASPYFFLDPAQVAADLRTELRPSHPGADGDGLLANVAWYLGRLAEADAGFGWLGAALAVAGIAFGHNRRTRAGRHAVLMVSVFIALVVVAHAAATLRWSRWMIPALPFVALLIGLGVEELRTRVLRRWQRPLVATAVAALVLAATVAQPLRLDIAWGLAKSLPRTQTLLAQWILENLPAGRAILIERQGVQLPAGRYELYEVDGASGRLVRIDPATRSHQRVEGWSDYGALADPAELDRAGIDFFVTSTEVQRPYRWNPDRYPEQIRRYDALLAAGELVHEVEREPGEVGGPRIGLYAWRGADPAEAVTNPR